MEETRLPKICLLRLIHLHRYTNAQPEYNWITQFNSFLEKINMSHLLETPNPRIWEEMERIAFERIDRHLKFSDIQICSSYTHMNCALLKTLEDETASYLLLEKNFHVSKIIIQLRMSTKYKLRFCLRGQIYEIDQNAQCEVCNLQKQETLSHFISECPAYQVTRNRYLSPLLDIASYLNANPLIITNCIDEFSVKMIYYYITNSLKLRSFLLDE